MEGLFQREIVRRAEGLRTQFVEARHRDALGGLVECQGSALHLELRRDSRGTAGQALEGAVERGVRLLGKRCVIEPRLSQIELSVILRRRELQNLHPFFHEIDERDEVLTIDPALIEPVRRAVRRHHRDDTSREQA